MKVEVLYVTEREKIMIQVLVKDGKLPEPGIYTVFFEKVEPEPVREFNE